MGAISNIVGAARALAGLVAQEQSDRLVAAENERDRLDAEVAMLREELARLREVLERERLDVREAMARNGAGKGEVLAVFMARLADERDMVVDSHRREMDRMNGEVERAHENVADSKIRLRATTAELDRASDTMARTLAALRPVAPGKLESLEGMAEDVAREYRILRDGVVTRARVDEWEQAVTEERAPVVEPPQVCRTCRSVAAGSDVRLPGAQGLCTALYVTTGSAVNASLYQLDSRPKACPGWNRGQ
jgi:hypothetical protein